MTFKLLPGRTYYNQKSLCILIILILFKNIDRFKTFICLEKIYLKLYQKGKFKNNDEVYNYLKLSYNYIYLRIIYYYIYNTNIRIIKKLCKI